MAGAPDRDRLAHYHEARPLEMLNHALGDHFSCDLERQHEQLMFAIYKRHDMAVALDQFYLGKCDEL